MIKNELNAVAEFHNAFGIESADSPIANIPSQTVLLRYNLMKEENEERWTREEERRNTKEEGRGKKKEEGRKKIEDGV